LIFCTQIYDYFVLRFGHHATDLATVPLMLLLCATNLADVALIWPPPYHRFGCLTKDSATEPQIWPSYHRFWPPCHKIGCRVRNLAPVPQIWKPCHRLDHCATYLANIFHKRWCRSEKSEQ